MSAVAREQSHANAARPSVGPNVREARDRILRQAFLLDLYPPIESFELREMRERMRVAGSFGRVA